MKQVKNQKSLKSIKNVVGKFNQKSIIGGRGESMPIKYIITDGEPKS